MLSEIIQLLTKIIDVLGSIVLWTISLALLAMGIFGGSFSFHINGMERWFK